MLPFLIAQKQFPELLMITEPEICLRNRRYVPVDQCFLRDDLGSFGRRLRSGAADNADAGERSTRRRRSPRTWVARYP
jgi:hypothetical protein